jgi:hypothetical protein
LPASLVAELLLFLLLFPTQFDSIEEAGMLRPEIFKPENVGPRNVSANGNFAGDVIRGYLLQVAELRC